MYLINSLQYIAYRMKLPATITETTANNTIPIAASIPKDSTIKEKPANCNNGNCEYPEIYSPAMALLDTRIVQLQECKLSQLTVWRALTGVLNHQFMRTFNNSCATVLPFCDTVCILAK